MLKFKIATTKMELTMTNNMINDKSNILKKYLLPLAIFLCFFCSTALAGDAQSLATISGRVQSNVLSVVKLLIVLSYCAGVGFAMAGVLQFKAHKDNPQQTPLSKPMVYLAVAAFLLFLPSLMGTAGSTIFGSNAGPTGSTDMLDISKVSPTPAN
jgi:intracellular multiplication protein IcmD